MDLETKTTLTQVTGQGRRVVAVGALAGIVLSLLSIPLSADDIYRWVDADGVINYTQQKPRDVDSEEITTRSGAPRVVADTPLPVPESKATGQPLNADQERMLEGLRATEQARQQEIVKLKEDNCQKSRDVLSRLTIKNRIRVKDDAGDYRVMAEDERQDRITNAQEGIALYCVQA